MPSPVLAADQHYDDRIAAPRPVASALEQESVTGIKRLGYDQRRASLCRIWPGLGPDPSGNPWIKSDGECIGFREEADGSWKQHTRFHLNSRAAGLQADGGMAVWRSRIPEVHDVLLPHGFVGEAAEPEATPRHRLHAIDLQLGETVGRVDVIAANFFKPFKPGLLLWHSSKEGLRIQAITPLYEGLNLRIECPEPSAVTAAVVRPGVFDIGCGFEDGRVRTWRVVQDPSKQWTTANLTDLTLHNAAVTSLAFLGEDRIASGGADRMVAVTRYGGEKAAFVEHRISQLLRCRGARIDGLRGPVEAAVLEQLIARDSAMPPVTGVADGNLFEHSTIEWDDPFINVDAEAQTAIGGRYTHEEN